MHHEYILGIDVAKAKLDTSLRLPNGRFRSKVVPNSPEGLSELSEWLKRGGVSNPLICNFLSVYCFVIMKQYSWGTIN